MKWWMSVCVLGLVAGALVTGALVAQEKLPAAKQPAQPEMQTVKDKASYVIGLSIGRNLAQDDLELKANLVARGLLDALAGRDPLLSDAEMEAAMKAFEQEIVGAQAEKRKALAEANLKAGQAFLAANAKREGVNTLPSGLQYKVLKAGQGQSPKLTDTVRTHYHGTLIDGTVFDSSVQRGEPITFPVNGVIKGWTEALQRMKVGDKWQLFVPANLAYGAEGTRTGAIGPNATLIFEVDLLGIEE